MGKQRRDVYGAFEQYLGLEHTDTSPKRAYSANQVTILLDKLILLPKKV